MYTVRVRKQRVNSASDISWENIAQVESVSDFDKEFNMAKRITTDVLHDWKHVQLINAENENLERYWFQNTDKDKKEWLCLFPRSEETDMKVREQYLNYVAQLPFYRRWAINVLAILMIPYIVVVAAYRAVTGKK